MVGIRRIIIDIELSGYNPQDTDILAWDIAFPPYVDFVMGCKQAAVQDGGLSSCRTCDGGGYYHRASLPRHV